MKVPASASTVPSSRLNAFVKVLVTPPSFVDPQKNILSQTLHYLLILCIFIAGSYAILTSFIADEPSGIILSGGMVVIATFLFWMLHQKRIRLVSTTLVVSAYLAIVTTLVMNGGIRDEAGLVLIALLSIAGFVMGMQAVIPLSVLTAVLLIVLFFAERLQLIPEEEHFYPVGADELAMTLIAVFVTSIILYQITRQIIKNTNEIEAQAQFLRQKNHQLKKTQSELIAAKELAEEANRSRSAFFSRMSHDLRTPLSGILGLATHLIQDGSRLSPEDQTELLQGIHRSGGHLLNLINDLLDISRLEAQQLKLHISPSPLLVVLSEVMLLLRITAEDKGIALRLQAADDLPEIVHIDEQRIQQVLINLLGNGIKFTASGEVTLIVTAVPRATAVPAICFEVVDTGCGIPSHDLEHIFDPFVQVADRHLQASGTGLGLAISRQLVETMGSELHVESNPTGSRFWFTLDLPEALP